MLRTVNKSVVEVKLIDLASKTDSYDVANRMLNWYQNFGDGLQDQATAYLRSILKSINPALEQDSNFIKDFLNSKDPDDVSVKERYNIGREKLNSVRILELEDELRAYVEDITLAVALEKNRKTLRIILKNLEESKDITTEVESTWSKSKSWLLRASKEHIGEIVETLKRKKPDGQLSLKFLKDREEMNDLLKRKM